MIGTRTPQFRYSCCKPRSLESVATKVRWSDYKGVDIVVPRGETPSHHLIMGFDTDLDRAMRNATYEVVRFLVAHYGLRSSEAFSVASAAVDFTVSEAVDEVQVITAMIPRMIFPDSLHVR